MTLRTTHMGNGLLLVLVVAAVSLGATGCLFQPRQADRPGSQNDPNKVPFIQPNAAAGVFANLKSGIENLDGANYERSLTDNFTFEPLLDDRVELGDAAFAGWDRATEVSVIEQMITGLDTARINFSQSININEAEFVQFRVSYDLRLVAGSSVTAYQGIANFDVRLVAGIWVCEKWVDVEKAGGFTTWGNLKGQLRLQIGGTAVGAASRNSRQFVVIKAINGTSG